jgi:hypothetical protein
MTLFDTLRDGDKPFAHVGNAIESNLELGLVLIIHYSE